MEKPAVGASHQRLGPVTHWCLTQEAPSSAGGGFAAWSGSDLRYGNNRRHPVGHVTPPPPSWLPGLAALARLALAQEPLEEPGSTKL